ncbi:MAG: phosphodiester glycosidase family protein [Bacteroidetes bacterium]|nr:phosphodiester glycosidase family protein [Bacteroidota bacterium]
MVNYGILLRFVLLVLLSGVAGPGRAQDPDNLVKIEKGTGKVPTGPAWRWANVDSAFGVLPAGVHVYRTEDRMEGRLSVAYYVEAPLKDMGLDYTTQVGYGKRLTPMEYYKQEGGPVVVINTSFFSFKTNGNLNVVVRGGKLVGWNQPSRHPKGDSLFTYTTRSAMGIDRSRRADVAWVFTDTTQPWPYAFEGGPVVARGRDSVPKLAALGDRHWKKWKMETVVGGGPVLVYDGKIRVTNEEEGLFVRGEKDIHPRSAIGYTKDGRIIVLAVQGRTPGVATGVTLAEEAKVLADLGCYEALNLDGGGSSCMLVNGKETIKPSDKTGERPVPSVFLIKKRS